MDPPNASPKTHSNSHNNHTATKTKTNMINDKQFEFCAVCKRNHNQGRRHNFFPNHKKSLAAALSRFHSKLSDIRFYLRNPIPLRPEHASLNRLWCLFCECDILERHSFYASCNAIRHLASADHLKNVKGFLWKYGGEIDKVDSFRITEAEFAKWEKKCKLQKKGAGDGGSSGMLIGPSNDIQIKTNSNSLDCFDKDNICAFDIDLSNGVVPLQDYTNERYQISERQMLSATNAPHLHSTCMSRQFSGNACSSISMTNGQDYMSSVGTSNSSCQPLNVGSVTTYERMMNRKNSALVLPNITRISTVQEDTFGNVHTGAPPPWFNETEKNQLDSISKSGGNDLPSLNQKRKSSKLNPNRVGAAWAERRKVELELERKGELVTKNHNVNWLPNFGRVWQSGTRKESRKEFQLENNKSAKYESQSESTVQLQPYVTKRKLLQRKDHIDE